MCHLPNSCFDKPTLEEILQALKEDGSDWALKQIEVTVSSFLGVRQKLASGLEQLSFIRIFMQNCLLS